MPCFHLNQPSAPKCGDLRGFSNDAKSKDLARARCGCCSAAAVRSPLFQGDRSLARADVRFLFASFGLASSTLAGFNVGLNFSLNLVVRDQTCMVRGTMLLQLAWDEGFERGSLDLFVENLLLSLAQLLSYRRTSSLHFLSPAGRSSTSSSEQVHLVSRRRDVRSVVWILSAEAFTFCQG